MHWSTPTPMMDADLLQLLERSDLRLRVQRAAVASLAALGMALAGAALCIFVARWLGHADVSVVWPLLPLLAAVLAGLTAFWRSSHGLPETAALLDRRAGTREQLTTWLHLRSVPPPPGSLHAAFAGAQAQGACEAAASLRLAQLLPWRLPAWHRAIWLALILLLSALLIPARRIDTAAEIAAPVRTHAAPASLSSAGATGALSQAAAPRVQVLSPAQMRKLQLMATDSELPPAAKQSALRELQDAIGSVPENELTGDVRELLNLLRKDQRASGTENQAGATASAANASPAKIASPRGDGVNVAPLTAAEAPVTSSVAQFPDVQDELRRYYEKSSK